MIDSMEQEDFDIRNQQPVTSRERDFENALRPLNFEDFSGQDKVVDNLRIFVKAARLRGEALDHVLLHGPPGLGKTTLSNIIANELGVGFKITSVSYTHLTLPTIRGIWRECLPAWSPMMYFSSTKYTG